MLVSGFKESRADEGTSPGAAFQANFRGEVNPRWGGEGKPAAERIQGTDALEVGINGSICAPDPMWKSCFVLTKVAHAQVRSGTPPRPSFPSIYWQNLSGHFLVRQGDIRSKLFGCLSLKPSTQQHILTGANCLWLHGDRGPKQPQHWGRCLGGGGTGSCQEVKTY